jgi:hypothetical protein
LTKKLPQVDIEKSSLRMLQLPQYHPLSTVMRLEPYRYFEFDAELQQYTSAFMGVHCEAAAYLSMVNAQVAQGTRPHHTQQFNANTANTQAICKKAFYIGW